MEPKNISSNINLSSLNIQKLDWDLVIDGQPYQVILIYDYIHSSDGSFGGNNYYCYPLGEELSHNNLLTYHGPSGGVRWDIRITENVYIKNKWNQSSVQKIIKCVIYRNDKVFYSFSGHDKSYVRSKAETFLVEIFENYPINFFSRDYSNDIVGRKIFYDRVPAIITRFSHIDLGIDIIPDGYPEFLPPIYLEDGEEGYDDPTNIHTTILDRHIYWYRK